MQNEERGLLIHEIRKPLELYKVSEVSVYKMYRSTLGCVFEGFNYSCDCEEVKYS